VSGLSVTWSCGELTVWLSSRIKETNVVTFIGDDGIVFHRPLQDHSGSNTCDLYFDVRGSDLDHGTAYPELKLFVVFFKPS
jgi:hypothetical protein